MKEIEKDIIITASLIREYRGHVAMNGGQFDLNGFLDWVEEIVRKGMVNNKTTASFELPMEKKHRHQEVYSKELMYLFVVIFAVGFGALSWIVFTVLDAIMERIF